jgi:hypothetical protein
MRLNRLESGLRGEKDQDEKRTSNSKGFQDFYTLVAKAIGWVLEWIQL